MAVRLNKALRILNVGINTVAEFLQKKGCALKDASPSAKITDEQYELLVQVFGIKKSTDNNSNRDEMPLELNITARTSNKNLAKIHAAEKNAKEESHIDNSKNTEVITSWESANQSFENNQVVTGFVKCRVKGGVVVEVFGIEAFMPASQIDIIRIYDFDDFIGKEIQVKILSINDETKNIVVSRRVVVEESIAKKTADKTLLKEIWQKHTEVQEQILRQRTAPISIKPELTTIINEKLHIRIDTSDNTESLKQQIIESLDLEESDCHFEQGYVLATIANWQKVDERISARIRSAANREYVIFTYYPVLDGKIIDRRAQFIGVKQLLDNLDVEYDFDKNNRLQISVEELNRLKDDEAFNSLQVALPNKASAIIPTYPSIIIYLEKLFPGLKCDNIEVFKNLKTKDLSFVAIDKQISVEGGYFKQETLDELNSLFSLEMCRVEYTFIIHDNALKNYDWERNKLGLPKLKNNTITFRKKIKKPHTDVVDGFVTEEITKEKEENEDCEISYNDSSEFFDYNNSNDFRFDFFIRNNLMKKLFGEGNYEYKEKYWYRYRENRTWATKEELDRFNDDLHVRFKPGIEFSVSANGASVGIDFNWKEESLPDILSQLSMEYPFIDFGIFKNGHKCNFDIQYKKANMTEIMNQLHNFSDDLIIELKKKGTELCFSREFEKLDDLLTFKTHLLHKLQTFDQSRYLCSISEVPSDKVKLSYFNDFESRNEERLESVRELKGADFTVGDLKIGRLIRTVNYPDLVFDISGDFYDITKQLFEETVVTSIIPDLSGDLEKLARLKESLNRIIEGRDVENPLLGEFIFDASKAAGIKDYDENIKLEIQEIGKHLLNKKIANNAPQKEAIAKAILAPELALIQGPPGTGKSTAIAELIWQHVRENPNTRILLTSETNLAVDNAIDRVVNPYHNLVKPIRIGDESRLEAEGLQFSYSAMYRWAKGEDISVKKKSVDVDEDEDSLSDTDDFVYEAPEKLILLNWMENIGRRMDKDRMPEEAQRLWAELLESPTNNIKSLFFDNYIANCNVVGATCSSIGQKNIIFTESKVTSGKNNKFIPTAFYKIYREIFSKRDNEHNPKIRFDVVIQDESSKATPAELSLPLIYGKKNVIIGDHRQLPPMLSRESFTNSFDYLIKREKNNDELQRIKELKSFVIKNFNVLEISHFERLYNQIDEHLKGVFNYQFRMHPAINDVIKQFYQDEGGLECGLTTPKDLGINDPDYMHNVASRFHGITAGPITPDVHVLWIDTNSPEMLDGTSRVNFGEVEVIRKLLRELNNSPTFHEYNCRWNSPEDKQIGLISFYGKQLRLLRDMSREFNPDDLPIRISTVDRFQGMERNIIIVSMVRSHCIQTERNQKPNFEKYGEYGYPKQSDLGFAQSPNRLNVALSRAKRLLIIVGNSKLFRTQCIYDNVYSTIHNHVNGKILTAREYGF